jgi:16S rRNA (cytosine1402-N4)-methyltransferase
LGDEKHAKIISKAIILERAKNPIIKTSQLSKIIQQIYPEKKNKNHPATKCFQAFRIFINKELEEFELSLDAAKQVIRKNGIIVTIAFHSLEDSIIKNFFNPSFTSFPKDIPLNNIEDKSFRCIAKKIRPSDEEIYKNPRSRSAIMRVFQKI